MPWWISIIFFILGWIFKGLYDWKVQPAITKSHKKREKKETEEEDKIKSEREEKINNLNRIWKNDRRILSNIKQPLKEFNQMNRFPDIYKAPKCLELASHIEKEVQKIQQDEFQEIKKKLLEYAKRKNQINQNSPLNILMDLFQKRIEPNKFEPLILCEEIDEILKGSPNHPYSEKDL